MSDIQFNKPFLTGKENSFVNEALDTGKISGNGIFTKRCQAFLEQTTGATKCLLTTSCTDALEMCAILAGIKPGDEVIIPSFTFVSTANAFILRGAKVVFADSREDHPGMDEDAIEGLITEKTKAIVPVHYAGVASDMGRIMSVANDRGIYVIEDAAQAIDSYWTDADGNRKALGTIGQMGTFSFHETKNLQCGEGGALLVNDPKFADRSEIIWEKGTNRAAFWRGEIDKYGWVDIGSSFLPSELTSAFLYAQLEELRPIQKRRREIWDGYQVGLNTLFEEKAVRGPFIPSYATNNAHMFYLVCGSLKERTALIDHLKNHGIMSVFHYQSLHASPYFKDRHDGRELRWSDTYSDRLLRLPLHAGLQPDQVDMIIDRIHDFYKR